MKLLVSVLAAASAIDCDAGWEWDQEKNNNTGACVDVNECNNGGCLGTEGANSCYNLEGSWRCGCSSGFLLQDDQQTCENINECQGAENPCTENRKTQCQDTYGSFECSCDPGWSGDDCQTDDNQCNGVTCQDNATCKDGDNSYECNCNEGFRENINGDCVDIDECDEESYTCGINQKCDNEIGGNPGYKCVCNAGYEPSSDPNACKDIDECANSGTCSEPFKTVCTNNDGGHSCGCDVGTSEDENGDCYDIDECAESGHDCAEFAVCDNIVLRDGRVTHQCSCPEGYSGDGYKNGTTEGSVAGTGCVDINECEGANPCGPNQTCSNDKPGHTCTCNWPRWTSDNQGGCRNVDECKEGQAFSCNDPNKGVCRDTEGGYACDCNEPQWVSDGADGCIDFDECANDADNNCGDNASCFNIDGGFYCECDAHWTGDGITCTDEIDCTDDSCGEHSHCIENIGAPFECQCDDGYVDVSNSTMPMDCQNYNECDNDDYDCSGEGEGRTKCSDVDGGYTCICDAGYAAVYNETGHFTCEDEIECGTADNCHANAQCTDGGGTFACACLQGYSGNGTYCANINECTEGGHNCGAHSQCSDNTPGFTCICDDGYKMEDGECVDKNECSGDGVFTCNESNRGMCSNTEPGYECLCNPGYVDNNGDCEDFDECNGPPNSYSCDAGEKCSNNVGGYDCVCENDDFKKNDAGECVPKNYCADDESNYGDSINGNTACGAGSCTSGTGGTWSCSCPQGYQNDFVTNTTIPSCSDVNECDSNPCVAPKGKCTNTIGGHECSCSDGYYNSDGVCIDYDECANGDHDCDGSYAKCTNLSPAVNAKGYQCECITGFELDGDLNCQDLNECDTDDHVCLGPNANQCLDNDGSYTCGCSDGYSRSGGENDPACYDDNECDDENICSRNNQNVCNNLPGTFSCTCNAGFEFDGSDPANCVDTDECTDGTFECGPENTKCSNNVGGYDCECQEGYEGADAKNGNCTDINECENNPNLCGDHGSCHNNAGGFSCSCDLGWKLNDSEDGCVDVDECNFDESYTYTCNENAKEKCVNTEGSYECACNQGYIADEQGDCTNLDECATGGDICHDEATCTDIVLRNGLIGYACACNEGWQGDGVSCTDIDECAGSNDCDSNASCSNTDGSYTCTCNAGWYGPGFVAEGGCSDINECDASSPGSSAGLFDCTETAQGQCSNTEGSYTCECNPGYSFAGEESDCQDNDECASPSDNDCGANTDCENVGGSFNCACKDGYEGNPRASDDNAGCTDKNECDDPEACEAFANSHCVNSVGGYACKCNDGYEEVNGKCQDIDECTDGTYECNDVNQSRCDNTVGGYDCLCETGFAFNGTACADIIECQLAEVPCDANADCFNFNHKEDGKTHDCACRAGYSGDGFTCEDNNECITQQWNGTHNIDIETGICGNGACTNIAGGYKCACDSGYESTTGQYPTCADVNECTDGFECNAANQGSCANNVGGYDCNCNAGYHMLNETIGCEDIDECAGAHSCDANAKCVNVLYSVNANGYQCDCEQGYQGNGTHCADVNECETGDHDCSVENNNGCVNHAGGFTCGCLDGYHDEHETGVCVDFQECASNVVHQCQADSTCKELDGSYECECDSGYRGNGFPGAEGCTNIDECAEGTHQCSEYASCSDTPGSYSCECEGDWIGDGFECSMCPSTECWDYDHDTKTCTPVQNETCSLLVCGYDGMTVTFDANLFGVNDGDEDWASIAQPSWNAGDGKYVFQTDLSGDGVTSKTVGDNIAFSFMVALGSESRARSDMATNLEYQFDNVTTVQSGPFAVAISFSCSYPRTVSVSSDSYDFEDASITDSFSGSSTLNQAFFMTLNNGDGASFVLGATLPVTVGWNIQGVTDISLYLQNCDVTHGDTSIAVIKDSCFSDTLNAEPRSSEGLSTSFSFRVFKGKGETAPSQTITCSVVICKDDDDTCGPVSSDGDCPSVSGYDYYAKSV